MIKIQTKFDTLKVFLKELKKKINFEKVSSRQQKHEKLPSVQSLRVKFETKARYHVMKS